MLPVGHALQFLGAQQQMQMQSLPAAQQMFMLYLQGQYMNQQAAMGAPSHSVAAKQLHQSAAGAEGGAGSQTTAGGPQEGASMAQSSMLEQQKALQAQLQHHQVRARMLQCVAVCCSVM